MSIGDFISHHPIDLRMNTKHSIVYTSGINMQIQHHPTIEGMAKWCLPGVTQRPGDATVRVHTYTIEGYWSLLRTYLHTSHGWTDHYLPLFLHESMFRSLHLPLSFHHPTPILIATHIS